MVGSYRTSFGRAETATVAANTRFRILQSTLLVGALHSGGVGGVVGRA